MYNDETNAKMQAEKAYYAQKAACPAESHPVDMCAQAVGKAVNPYSLQEEAAQRANHHYGEANKAQSAAVFFAQNPAFEDFIRLVRQGAIKF